MRVIGMTCKDNRWMCVAAKVFQNATLMGVEADLTTHIRKQELQGVLPSLMLGWLSGY